ncbi:MAG: BolA family transcriptional regulator [Hyphomicrobiaceae bacterium]|nr:BolA family transcriptional regulator [Hyphomicrobiaceae bacterium]
MTVTATIKAKLTEAFRPLRLEVMNESHLHAGHRGSPGTGESHFRVRIVAPAFAGKTRLERHRLVHEALAAELKGKVHALALEIHAPSEPGAKLEPQT